jgi:hypothetical protein
LFTINKSTFIKIISIDELINSIEIWDYITTSANIVISAVTC